MTKKVATVDLKGKAYAQVKDRIKEFRADCPNGLIETFPMIEEGYLMFKARILKDKSDPASAEATGHSYIETTKGSNKEKFFEKQETIAVGRALANLGYSIDGEIASSEEMEEFLTQKEEKLAEEIMEATEQLGNCTTIKELQKVWASLSADMKKYAVEIKNAKKKELETVKEEVHENI